MFGPAYVGNAVMDKNSHHLNVIQINKLVMALKSEQFYLELKQLLLAPHLMHLGLGNFFSILGILIIKSDLQIY